MTREALSSIDRAWLRMEDPTHPMMITVLPVFDAPVDFDQLQAVLERRLLRFPRFRQRVVQSRERWDSAAWEDDPAFDLDHHLRQIRLPTPGDEVALRAIFLVDPLRIWHLARAGSGTVAALSKLLWRTPDSRTSFKGRLGVSKEVALSRPVALAEVKAVGRAVGGTVNDVMLAAAAGALRRYLRSHGEPVGGLTIRAGLSVNLRPPDAKASLGNQAGALLVELPVGVDTALERLQQVKRQMDGLKESPEASVIWALLHALGNAPPSVQDVLVGAYCTRDTAVVANVPGPAETVYLAGAPLSSLLFWVPSLGGVGLCLSVASYARQVWFGAGADQGLVPDPEELVAGFHAEFEALQRATQALAQERDSFAMGEDTIEALNTMLDEALAKVDALLKEKG